MKRLCALLLTLALTLGVFAGMATTTQAATVVAKGIDVSKWQMPVDWTAVAANPDIDYAIIRCTWSGLETTEWSTFYAGAKAAGVPIGAYAYTMATTVAQAKEEAQKTVELLKGKQFEYPIYIDTEEPDLYDGMDKATLTAIVKAECDVLRDAGYMAGVYTNTWYATSKLDMTQLSQYTVWLADYSTTPGYTGKYDMWQYSCDGIVNGVTGTVDMNYCYVDFPTMIKKAGLNGYEADTVVAKGIDVSKWQKPVDWAAVAADPDVDFAIIRCAWSGLESSEFAEFYEGAKGVGLPIGAYSYVMATTVEEAETEAKALVEILKGKQFEYPIYIDAEEPGIHDSMDAGLLTSIIKTQVDILEDAGYFAGVYTNTWFATSKLDMTQLVNYTLWLADYTGGTPAYTGDYAMWQYSCDGIVNGVTGTVDMNYCYADFPTIIKEAGLNGYEKELNPPDETNPQVEAFRALKEQLPSVELLDLSYADAVAKLKVAYDAIEDSQKFRLTQEEMDYVTAAVEKIANLQYLASLGDVNEDGEINAKDALEVLKFAVGKTLLTQKQQKAAEVIGDEDINAKDALEILKYSVQKINKFPVEG